jgi:hypothetical protein
VHPDSYLADFRLRLRDLEHTKDFGTAESSQSNDSHRWKAYRQAHWFVPAPFVTQRGRSTDVITTSWIYCQIHATHGATEDASH